jgi:hypothetical protein
MAVPTRISIGAHVQASYDRIPDDCTKEGTELRSIPKSSQTFGCIENGSYYSLISFQ